MWYVIIAIVAIFLLLRVANKKEKAEAKAKAKTEVNVEIKALGEERFKQDPESERTYSTIVAGLKFHVPAGSSGAFFGLAVPDPDNKYDKNAVMIVTTDGQMIGYIPKDDLKVFRKWSEGNPIPCVGYYEPDGESFHSNMKCIRPYTEEFINEEKDRYMEWYNENKA